MSDPRPGRPANDDVVDKRKNTVKAPDPVPGAGSDKPDAGQTTGAEQAAENRENDPPA